uniref:Reverse transcriptase Ty1/copia-type domain-containing protein n=1 Tax=Tanacetum cinerariifolium TaxID=118510 RepID=A0A6L2NMK2_TANCI|nr:hypothetical protein [Tanacetum cinerariifolium]
MARYGSRHRHLGQQMHDVFKDEGRLSKAIQFTGVIRNTHWKLEKCGHGFYHKTTKENKQIKILFDVVGITAAHVYVNTAQMELVLLRKNDDPLIIEEWVLDDEEENVTQPKIEKKIVRPSIDYEEIDGGYVAFGGNPKGGKITGKGTKSSDNAGLARKETEPVKDYILLPLWTVDLPFSQDSKSSHDDGFKPSSVDGKKVDEDPSKECERNDQEKEDNVKNTNNVNTVSLTVDAAGTNKDNELPFDPNMHALENGSIFNFLNDDEGDVAVANMNNLDTTIQGNHNRNKARLAAQGHTQEKWIDYDEVFIPVIRIEAIRLFLAYASFKILWCIKWMSKVLFSMKSLKKRYNGFQRGKIDKTLFIRRHKGDILPVQVYVDDIIFGSTKKELCNAFERYLKVQPKLGLSCLKDSPFDLVAYTDNDYAEASLDRKYTTRGC